MPHALPQRLVPVLEATHRAHAPGVYALTVAGEGGWTFFAGPRPDEVDEAKPVAARSGPGGVRFDTPAGWRRMFVRATLDGQRFPLLTERVLPFPNLVNFRDLGGYPVEGDAGGRRVRWNRLLRSGHWALPDDGESAVLSEMGIDTIIDFRGDDERDREPDRVPKNLRRTVNLPIPAGDMRQNQRLRAVLASNDANAARALMHEIYAELPVKFIDAYRDFFAAVLEARGPVVFHCTAGKDRTGVAGALLLRALGVGMSTVLSDYLISHAIMTANAEVLTRTEGEAALPFLGVDTSYLKNALRAVVRRYGSTRRYLRRELGVDIEALREAFLTDAE